MTFHWKMRQCSMTLVWRVAKPYLELFTLLPKRVLTTNSGEIAMITVPFTCFNSIRMPFVQSLKQVDILLIVRRPMLWLACSSFPLFITFRGFYLSALIAGCPLVLVLINMMHYIILALGILVLLDVVRSQTVTNRCWDYSGWTCWCACLSNNEPTYRHRRAKTFEWKPQ